MNIHLVWLAHEFQRFMLSFPISTSTSARERTLWFHSIAFNFSFSSVFCIAFLCRLNFVVVVDKCETEALHRQKKKKERKNKMLKKKIGAKHKAVPMFESETRKSANENWNIQ